MVEVAGTAAAFAVALGAIELAKLLAGKLNGGRSRSYELRRIAEVVVKTDADGVPLVYSSRAIGQHQRAILDELRGIKTELSRMQGPS